MRRGILVVIGGASFERLFCPEGREFEQANLQKFKCLGGCPGGDVELSNSSAHKGITSSEHIIFPLGDRGSFVLLFIISFVNLFICPFFLSSVYLFFHSSICYLSTRQFVQHNRVCSLFNGRSVSTGDSAEISEGKWTAEPSVLLNPYASGASFSRGRISRDPLPSRPDEETTRTENLQKYYKNRKFQESSQDFSRGTQNFPPLSSPPP